MVYNFNFFYFEKNLKQNEFKQWYTLYRRIKKRNLEISNFGRVESRDNEMINLTIISLSIVRVAFDAIKMRRITWASEFSPLRILNSFWFIARNNCLLIKWKFRHLMNLNAT